MFSSPGLRGLLGDSACSDVVKDLLPQHILELGTEAAVQHLRHILCQALKEPRGVVAVVLQPLLVLAALRCEVIKVIQGDGLTGEGERGSLDTLSQVAALLDCTCCAVRVVHVHLQQGNCHRL